ncbi:MAG: sulfur transferase domain-containing protein [Maricaulaceae bacterium]|jgi:uncharacterized protein (TIGR01244 family)
MSEGTRLAPVGEHNIVARDPEGGVYLGGQPSLEDLNAWAGMGVKLVINTRSKLENAEIGFDMGAETAARGMSYVEIPMGGADGADPSIRERVTAALERCDGACVIHCRGGPRAAHAYAAHLLATGKMKPEDIISFGWPGGLSSETLAALGAL